MEPKKPFVIAVTSTKGGVGKTTLSANLGALFAQLGMRVLLIDADVQPSLSNYFKISYRAPFGLDKTVRDGGFIHPDRISRTDRTNLDLVFSDAPGDGLQTWLKPRPDRLFILKSAVRSPAVVDHYDVVIIDTQGAIGELQQSAAMAADILICPVNPTKLSVAEFRSGTMGMLDQFNFMKEMTYKGEPCKAGSLYALIYGMNRSADARAWASQFRQTFRAMPDVRVMDTVIPESQSYRTAGSLRIAAYETTDAVGNRSAAYETMHQLIWEIFPNFKDTYFDDHAAADSNESGATP